MEEPFAKTISQIETAINEDGYFPFDNVNYILRNEPCRGDTANWRRLVEAMLMFIEENCG